MTHLYRALVGGLLLFGIATSGRSDDPPPTYKNVKIVALDATARTLLVENADGRQESMLLDDTAAGFGDVKPGDAVILTLRQDPGRTRVSALVKSTARRPPVTAIPSATPKGTAATATSSASATATYKNGQNAFAEHVAALAQQADRVDVVWREFRKTCAVITRSHYEGAREWVGLWDDQVTSDLSTGSCRDLQNQIVNLGEAVNQGMTAAEDAARHAALSRSDIGDVRRRYSMDWDGWGHTPPDQVTQ